LTQRKKKAFKEQGLAQNELGVERSVTNDGHGAKQRLSPAVVVEHGTARVRSTAIVIFIHYIIT
jgi:hypothetical protein